VECERDFSLLQDLLTEKRLNLRDVLVTSYVLAKKAPHFMKIQTMAEVPSASKKRKKEKSEKELGNKKMTSFFAPKKKQLIVNSDNNAGSAVSAPVEEEEQPAPGLEEENRDGQMDVSDQQHIDDQDAGGGQTEAEAAAVADRCTSIWTYAKANRDLPSIHR